MVAVVLLPAHVFHSNDGILAFCSGRDSSSHPFQDPCISPLYRTGRAIPSSGREIRGRSVSQSADQTPIPHALSVSLSLFFRSSFHLTEIGFLTLQNFPQG